MCQANSSQRLQTFSIGFQGSSDLYYARMVAEKIGSEHHEIVSTPEEFFAAIPEVIRTIESYDITTVRASVGNYLVSKAIREKTSCKVVFNGDGSDEVFGSYLYFYRAPTAEAYEAETTRLLKDIAYFDVLRSDRSISAHGLEARTPFLDRQFVNLAKALPTVLRRPTKTQKEKHILRQAFAKEDLLPTEVLWRRKEAFSDGVSGQEKAWYQEIAERLHAQGLIPSDWEERAKKFRHLPPKTPEAYYYRQLFEQYYGQYNAEKAVPYFWMPRWSGETTDPSARTLSFY
jgi:asparagine synthase (glutamine-hydrolysing)